MTIARGARLGPYKIVAIIGKGGMGEVYRARDTRLDRTVAIKVLPEHRLFDPEMRQRFVREARAIGNLNHPNICHLNDLGSHEGFDFLVMEHLEGETLADRLSRARAPLRLEDVFRNAIEIAEALSEAHRQGIVHRDLKPGNIMVTPSGIKLLDFGLAKFSQQPSGGAAALSTLGVDPAPLTSDGAVLGTWQYMAPEQLEGKESDARADIFAFGAVVHEMATGRKAFEGESQASVIAAILERDPPPLSSLQPEVPAALDRLVRKCLAKNPEARWQTARDLADELKWIAEQYRQPIDASNKAFLEPVRRPPVWRWLAGLVGAGVAAGAVAWTLAPRGEPNGQPIRRFSIHPPAPAVMTGSFAISPDGQHVVYRARANPGSSLYVRPLDQLESRALPGTERAETPTFSRDSTWVAVLDDGKLKKLSLSSSAAPITLSDLPGCCAGDSFTWLPDDTLVVPLIGTGLVRVSGQGGTLVPLTRPEAAAREIDHHSPVLLPNGKALLLGVHRGAEAFDVAVQPLDGGARRVLVNDAFRAQYTPTGHLLFVRGDTLFAAPFDADRIELTGTPVAVVEHVATIPGSGAANYQFSDDGTLVYAQARSVQGRRLLWADRRGGTQPLPIGPRGVGAPSLSPDGRRLAFHINEGSRSDIWIYEFATESLSRVTFDGTSATPIWTPDSRRIVFSSTREGRRQIYWQPADGSGQPELLVADEHSVWPGSWSTDHKTFAFTRQPPTDRNDIGLFRLGEGVASAPFVAGSAEKQWPRISPDGRWLAYMSTETGRSEIYVIPLSGSGAKRQISLGGGTRPVWSRDGRELYYRRGGRRFMVVAVDALPAAIGKPVELPITVQMASGETDAEAFGHPGFDVSPEGRLLIVEPAPATGSKPDIVKPGVAGKSTKSPASSVMTSSPSTAQRHRPSSTALKLGCPKAE